MEFRSMCLLNARLVPMCVRMSVCIYMCVCVVVCDPCTLAAFVPHVPHPVPYTHILIFFSWRVPCPITLNLFHLASNPTSLHPHHHKLHSRKLPPTHCCLWLRLHLNETSWKSSTDAGYLQRTGMVVHLPFTPHSHTHTHHGLTHTNYYESYSRIEQVPLRGVVCKARITQFAAEVEISQRFHNDRTNPIEAVYVLKLFIFT